MVSQRFAVRPVSQNTPPKYPPTQAFFVHRLVLTRWTLALVRVRVGLATRAAVLARRRQARNVLGVAVRSGVASLAKASVTGLFFFREQKKCINMEFIS